MAPGARSAAAVGGARDSDPGRAPARAHAVEPGTDDCGRSGLDAGRPSYVGVAADRDRAVRCPGTGARCAGVLGLESGGATQPHCAARYFRGHATMKTYAARTKIP